jgi:hypothetical protein
MSTRRLRFALFAPLVLSALGAAACGGDPQVTTMPPQTTATADPTATSDAIEQVYHGNLTVSQAQSACRCKLELVRVGGTVFHFGLDLSQSPPVSFPFQSTVADARVWIAEAPITRKLNIHSDAGGNWSFVAVKLQGTPLPISFVYEKAGYPTTKSQVFQIGDAGISDVSVQFPTDAYFTVAKAQIEQQIGALIGAPYVLNNVLVTTVGKAWASMFSPDLPHGDPGAQVTISPPIQFPAGLGPVYFNEAVAPDPTINATSVDGGVLFGNLANGSYSLSATKAPFSYSTLTFVIQDGIALYIASPPHGIQSTNTSAPGQP